MFLFVIYKSHIFNADHLNYLNNLFQNYINIITDDINMMLTASSRKP